MAMTATDTAIQNAAIDTSATTSDSVTITWDNPVDTDGYTGVTITADPAVGNLSTETVAVGTNTLTISDLTAETEHMLMLTFATEYGDTNKGSSSDHTISVTTQSNRVTNVAVNGINTTVLTLIWQNPEDTTNYSEVMITSDPAVGNIATPQTVPMATNTFSVTGLTAGTSYRFTFATIYSGGKSGSSNTIFTIKTLTAASIDSDADTLIDITSLERLHNMRHTLDGSSYKTSSTDPGSQCGIDGTIACTGYELTRSLDFTDIASYDGSIPNAMRIWRPNSMANSMGSILPQALADDGTNSGWNPIGTTATRFNSRFEGNGHTISNLYGRRSTVADLGLFGGIGANSVIRSIGVATVRLYGSDSTTDIGALVGDSNGTIVASYASGTINSGMGNDNVGGLVGTFGTNTAAVVASYAAVSVNNNGGDQNRVGGLIGAHATGSSIITANYASGAVTGGTTADFIGGLLGVGRFTTIIIASYASGTVNHSGGDSDIVGGLVGSGSGSTVVASYATGTVDGGEDTNFVGALGGRNVNATASYGFGTVTGGGGGSDGSARTGGVAGVGSGIVGARTLTLDNAGAEWNQVNSIPTIPPTPITTMDAWDFGTATQAPVLKYADYDGTEDTYGCIDATTPTSTATIVIPSVVATPTGPMRITCGTTPLPGQVR